MEAKSKEMLWLAFIFNKRGVWKVLMKHMVHKQNV